VRSIALDDATLSHPSFDAPLVPAGSTGGGQILPVIFKVTVTSGAQTTSVVKVVGIQPAPAPLQVGTLSDITVDSGQRVSLSAPRASGGVAPYKWTIQQTTPGPSVGVVLGANPGFTAPTLAPGAADLVIGFNWFLTDQVGNTATVPETVTVTAPALPFAASYTGPSSAEQGTTVSLQTNVTGGKAPYYYSFSEYEDRVSIPNTANPSFVLPTLAPGDPEVTLAIFLRVSDSSDPPQDVIAGSLSITVAAPAVAPSGGSAGVGTSAPSTAVSGQAGGSLASLLSTPGTTSRQLLESILASAASLPESAKTEAVPGLSTPPAGCNFPLTPRDTYGGDCKAEFTGLCSVCYVAEVCATSCGYSQGVTPEMKAALDQNAQALAAYFAKYPNCNLGYLKCGPP